MHRPAIELSRTYYIVSLTFRWMSQTAWDGSSLAWRSEWCYEFKNHIFRICTMSGWYLQSAFMLALCKTALFQQSYQCGMTLESLVEIVYVFRSQVALENLCMCACKKKHKFCLVRMASKWVVSTYWQHSEDESIRDQTSRIVIFLAFPRKLVEISKWGFNFGKVRCLRYLAVDKLRTGTRNFVVQVYSVHFKVWRWLHTHSINKMFPIVCLPRRELAGLIIAPSSRCHPESTSSYDRSWERTCSATKHK